jgi:hypothetical protein
VIRLSLHKNTLTTDSTGHTDLHGSKMPESKDCGKVIVRTRDKSGMRSFSIWIFWQCRGIAGNA